MVMRIYAVLLALVAACSFNERDFGDRLCTGDEDCPRPDQACIQNTCTQKACSNDLQCGTTHDFVCAGGLCVVDTCGAGNECELGYACETGFCQASFNVVGVMSTSNTSIAVTFDAPPDETTATEIGNYVVDGLTVSGTPTVSGSTVTLATSPQTQTSYNVTVSGVTREFDKAPLIVATGTFTGRDPFRVASAMSTSAITVQVTFSEAPDPASAANLANYAIAGLAVSGTPTIAGNTVTITTESQAQIAYTVMVSNVRRASDSEALTAGTAMFTGRDDFNVALAEAKSSTQITVTFDAAPNAAQATTLANYSIAPALALSGAPTLDGSTVTLTTAAQTATMYTVTVANVTRASDAETLTLAGKDFMGRAPFNVADAAAMSSTSIAVTFDAPPNADAMTLANYSVPGLTLSGVPVISGNIVTITTSPQAAQNYAVTVSNVKRGTDNEALTGTTANFAGRSPFNVTSAMSTSSTSVAVTFSHAPNAGQAVVPASYAIAGLTVLGASLSGTTVTLTTSPQADATYTVVVTGVTRGSDGEVLTTAMQTFAGRAPFNVMTAMSPSPTSIRVTFDAAPSAAAATTLVNYSVPGLTLSGTPVLNGNSVTITTSTQTAQDYTVTVTNVTRSVDSEPLTLASYTFAGRPRFDVESAASTSNVTMAVTFDAPPDPAMATTLANYSVQNLTLSGTPTLSGNTVTITTSTQTGGQNYTVTVANVVRDSDDEPLFVNQASFVGRTGFNVTSAASVNTTTMSVTFDDAPKPAEAMTLANYTVPGLTLSGTPTLAGNTVTITTSPQAEGSYTVAVGNVHRNSDNSPLVVSAASFSYVSFNVAGASSVTNRSITVTFDAPPTAAQATNIANYSVPGLTLTGTPVLAGSTVTIQTSSQSVFSYTVMVNNVTRASDGSTLANTNASFIGRTSFDVASAVSVTSGSVAVTFSHAPDPGQATTRTNYTIPGLTLSGTPVLNGSTVTLTTSVQTATSYTVAVANVTRASDAEPLGTNMATFTGKAQTTPTVTNVGVQATVPDNGTKFYNTGTATVVITGTEFTGVMCPGGVTLDDQNGLGTVINTPATSCSVDSATQITATFPAGIRTNGTTGWNVRVTNAVGTNPTSAVKLVPFAGLLVSEVFVGVQGGGNGVREFIELYNPTNNTINVNNLGLSVHVRSAGGTDTTLALNTVSGRRNIPSHGFMLVTSTQSSGDAWFAKRDQTYDASLGELVSSGGVYLSLSTTAQSKVLDKVGWGSQPADGREGTAVTNIGNGESTQRKPANGSGATTDTDVNSSDFLNPSTSTTPKGTNDAAEP